MHTDPVADFLTRIRNGCRARKPRVDIPRSGLKLQIAAILKQEGYIEDFREVFPTGDVQGLIQEDDGTGTLVPVAAATVLILPPGGVENDAIASTASEANGAYMVLGLEPGTYDILAELGTKTGRVDGQLISVANATIVDVVISD